MELVRETIKADVLVIGGGLAGCMAAIGAGEIVGNENVLLVEKANIQRSGNAGTGVDHTWSYIPEAHLFKICDYATYRSLIMLRHWEAAAAYKSDWERGIQKSKTSDGKKKWAAQGYRALIWV